MGILSDIGGLIGGAVGGKEQNRYLKRAAGTITGARDKLQAFMDEEYATDKPLREAGLQYGAAGAAVLPTLREYALNPTSSEQYKLQMAEGLQRLQQDFATRGSPQSGAAAIAAGRYAAGLTAAERDRAVQSAQFLGKLGLEAPRLSEAGRQFYSNLYPNIRGYNEDLATIEVGRGNQAAQMWGNIGKGIGGLGDTALSLYSFSGGGGGMGGPKAYSAAAGYPPEWQM
jgi:hypothetical protein